MWGYADVGADIYVALGIVALAALGFTPLAFLAAGLVYAMVGLCYAELASAYPVAGGGQYFALRGLGDLWGFVAGSALLLDYTIDIALFTVIAFGYFNFFLPFAEGLTIHIGPTHVHWFWLLETLAGILVLVWMNVRGIKVSSAFNNFLGVIAIIGQAIIVIAGFSLVWDPGLVVSNFTAFPATFGDFALGSSLAIISFVGLESISQVAQETRRPVAIIQTLIAFFTPGGSATSNGAIELLTDLYAFGATTGYLIVFVSLITLRFKDPYTPRPYHMPLNFPLTYRGTIIQFPVLGVFGLVGVAITWFEVILTHPLGRIAGPAWVVLCGLLYMLYRRRQSLPAAGNVPRYWDAAQKRVLQEAEEYESLEAYEAALAERDGVLAAQP